MGHAQGSKGLPVTALGEENRKKLTDGFTTEVILGCPELEECPACEGEKIVPGRRDSISGTRVPDGL